MKLSTILVPAGAGLGLLVAFMFFPSNFGILVGTIIGGVIGGLVALRFAEQWDNNSKN